MTGILRTGGSGPAPPPWRRDAALLAVVGAAALVWLLVTIPLALGERTLYFRDVFNNHLPLKAYGAAQLAAGEVPAFNPILGLGYTFRGNPSALAFYPGNLLYLALPFWSAFNLHFALHWLLAGIAMAVLARQLALGRWGTLAAALTYAGSGYVLSCLSFYNLMTVAAWWPLAMAGAVRGGRRGVALGGLACGMALLGGEPLTAALGMLPLVVATVGRHGARGLLHAFGVGAIGLAVAAPQVVATARVLGFSFRGYHGTTVWQAQMFWLPPLRYLELFLPFPFGWPLDLGPGAWWAWDMAPDLVYFLSLYAGIVGLWLAAGAVRRRPVWGVVALGGLALAWLWGSAGDTLTTLTGGLFRFPEKFLFWYALALPPLVGWGLEAALERPRRRVRVAWVASALLAVAGVALLLARPALVRSLSAVEVGGPLVMGEVADVQAWRHGVYLLTGGLLLAAAGWAARHRRAGVVVALQLVALLQLFPLVRTTSVDTFRRATPWVQRLAPGTAVFHTLDPRPVWEPVPDFRFPGDQRDVISYASALDLDAVPGMFYGLTFPLAADPEGLSSSLHTFLGVELALAEWRERVPWLRALGVEYFVTHRPLDDPTGVELVAEEPRFGARSFLYRVQGPAPPVWWPRRVVASPGPRAAFVQVSRLADPVATVVAAETFEQPPGGRATIVEEGADRVVLEVDSPGGLVVLRRSYHPLYRVRAGDRELATEPVNLTLLGITVPPGRHRVVVDVDGAPEALAAGAGGLAALAALLAGLLRRPGRAAPSPRAGEGTAAGQGAARVVEPEPVAGGGASSA